MLSQIRNWPTPGGREAGADEPNAAGFSGQEIRLAGIGNIKASNA